MTSTDPIDALNPVPMVSGRDPISTMSANHNSLVEETVTESPLQTDNSRIGKPDSDVVCQCVALFTLYQWNKRSYQVRRGQRARATNMAGGAVFCACQVVKRADGRPVKPRPVNMPDHVTLGDPRIYAERSGRYVRPWYGARYERTDRS